MRFSFIFVLFSSFLTSVFSGNKVVYMLAPPRSLSTVFMKMIGNRSDFTVYMSPTAPLFLRKVNYEGTKDWFQENAFKSFDEVKESVFESAKNCHVFVKDLSYMAYDYVMEDKDLQANPRFYYIFLVRDPHHSSISFYKKKKMILPNHANIIGLKKLFEEYEAIKKVNPNGVRVMFSEQLYKNVQEVMKAYCEFIGVKESDEVFEFKPVDLHKDWHEQLKESLAMKWHGRAQESTFLGRPSTYALDDSGKPTFEEVENIDHREKLMQAYLENVPYYQRFLEAEEDFLIKGRENECL